MAHMAKMFGTSERNLRRNARNFGLPSRHDCVGYYSMRYVVDAFGYSPTVCNSLFATVPKVARMNGDSVIHHVPPAKFWKWAWDKRDELDFSKYRRGAIPKEPKWLDEQIKIKKYRGWGKEWTDTEIATLKTLYAHGKSYEYIADKLGRSYKSVTSKYYRVVGSCDNRVS